MAANLLVNDHNRNAPNSILHMLLHGILSNNGELVLEVSNRIERQLEEEASQEVLSLLEEEHVSEHHKLICRILAHDNTLASLPGGADMSLPLHLAVRMGSLSLCKEIYKAYPDAAKTPNNKGKLALHHAARFGNANITEFLLSVYPQGAAFASRKQKIPLHFSAAFGHLTVSQMLLKVHPVGAMQASNKGKLPLHHAAKWGRLAIVQLLLHRHPEGARFLDWEGSLPLHDASLENQEATAITLIKAFPQALQQCNIRGELPLFSAVRNNNPNMTFAMLQIYPEAGKLVLQNLNENDGINYIHWRVIELCLRCTTGYIASVDPTRYGIDPSYTSVSVSTNRNRLGFDASSTSTSSHPLIDHQQSMLQSVNSMIPPTSLRYVNSLGLNSSINPFFARVMLLEVTPDQQQPIGRQETIDYIVPTSQQSSIISVQSGLAPVVKRQRIQPRTSAEPDETSYNHDVSLHGSNHHRQPAPQVFTTFLPLHAAIHLNSSLPVLRKALENCSDQLGKMKNDIIIFALCLIY